MKYIVQRKFTAAGRDYMPGEEVTGKELPRQFQKGPVAKRWIVDADLVPEVEEPAEDEADGPPDGLAAMGLSASIVKLLADAGLDSPESIAKHAQENSGLQSIGLGPQQEKSVFTAIAASKEAAEADA